MNLNGVDLPAHYNGVGFHDTPGSEVATWDYNTACTHAQELKAHGVTLYKLFGGTTKVSRARAYYDNGILTAIRFWFYQPWGQGNYSWIAPSDQWRMFRDAGCQLIEIGNEWNIADEWKDKAIPGDPAKIATEVVNAWERILQKASEAPGCVPLFPSNTPGGNVDHRRCYQAIVAELNKRGLMDSVVHVAIHPRPHNNPPDATWTATNTVTFDEWRWIRDCFRGAGGDPVFWCTEHGYSIGDSQNASYPPIDLAKHTDYNWELQMRMNPTHPKAIEQGLAGTFHWFEAGYGHWGAWPKDALKDSIVPEMPAPSPVWVRMGQQVSSLNFERITEDQPPPPSDEQAEGIDVSQYQTAAVDWAGFKASGGSFAFIRSTSGLSLDPQVYRHFNQSEGAGLLRGCYHYLSSSYGGREQARFYYSVYNDLPVDLPAVVDVESTKLTAQQVHDFIDRWEELTAEPLMIYTSKSKWEAICGKGAFWAAGLLLWVAHYDVDEPALPDIWDTWHFWQYGVKTGAGYPTAIDRDRYWGTAADLEALYGDGPEPPPPDDEYDMLVTYKPGGPYIQGNYPEAGITIANVWPGGYTQTTTSGSKPEYGTPGGFILDAPEPGVYILVAEDAEYECTTYAGQTVVVSWRSL